MQLFAVYIDIILYSLFRQLNLFINDNLLRCSYFIDGDMEALLENLLVEIHIKTDRYRYICIYIIYA